MYTHVIIFRQIAKKKLVEGGGVIDKEHQNEENDILCCRWQHPCEQAAGGDKAPGDAISPRRGRGGEGVQRGEGVTSGGRGGTVTWAPARAQIQTSFVSTTKRVLSP